MREHEVYPNVTTNHGPSWGFRCARCGMAQDGYIKERYAHEEARSHPKDCTPESADGYWHQGKQLVGADDEPHPFDADGVRPRQSVDQEGKAVKYPCKGVTYASVDLPDVDGPWQQVVECDDVRGCGWRVVLSEYGIPDGKWDTSISSDDFLPLHQQHLDHRAATTEYADQEVDRG